ncbi:purF [Wigglesworthia glossinidia endosymbiont of Glossina brevipalpis]|uniref:Amidophosphoribosyltransferase n=1 Tax=Wigglesworthia glossinidia brevipalpis TaxID=36870 RepID=Q8D2P1_WIGBR|nr:purF [Wigglesworthia glossinidia endosymbiont of Glossina brevipalpis]
MCGVIGISGVNSISQSIYDALTVLQHRGQDSAGITTIDKFNCFRVHKSSGLVKDVFKPNDIKYLKGKMGIGHVRYPTTREKNIYEAQPLYVNSPFGITLAHNGNIINTKFLKKQLFETQRRHINTNSDSEILLNIFASELNQFHNYPLHYENIFSAIKNTHKRVKGAYSCVGMIIGHGLFAFRDPYGIRPLVLGERTLSCKKEYIIASETVALDILGFKHLRDVAPGEGVLLTNSGKLLTKQCSLTSNYCPCLFEYIYFSRPDSIIDKISVYTARMKMGQILGKKISREWKNLNIDAVIPIPETSCDVALEIARILKIPYRQGFVKNRYVGRTFIMSNPSIRKKSIRYKFNVNKAEFYKKQVLLVDDSIVRGNTSKQIVEMARDAGANSVYLASASPEIRFPNIYGIDIPDSEELIAHQKSLNDIRISIKADALIFQNLNDLEKSLKKFNPKIKNFESSIFNGIYPTSLI